MAKIFDGILEDVNKQLSAGLFDEVAKQFRVPEISSPLQQEKKSPLDISIKESAKQAGSFARDIFLFPAKTAISAGITTSRFLAKVLGLPTPFEEGIIPSNKVEKLFFGEQPIMEVGKNEEKLLESLGVSHNTAKIFSFPLGLMFGALDIAFPSPFGGAVKKGITENIFKKLVEKYGDDVAKFIANTDNGRFAALALTDEGTEVVSKFANAVDEVSAELSYAVPGQRIFLDTGEVIGAESTFPKWVLEHLRKRSLFDPVLESLQAGKVPNGSAQRELYNLIQKRIAELSGIPETEIAQLKYSQPMSQAEEDKFLKSLELELTTKIEKKTSLIINELQPKII